jgi:hypothetical protein
VQGIVIADTAVTFVGRLHRAAVEDVDLKSKQKEGQGHIVGKITAGCPAAMWNLKVLLG